MREKEKELSRVRKGKMGDGREKGEREMRETRETFQFILHFSFFLCSFSNIPFHFLPSGDEYRELQRTEITNLKRAVNEEVHEKEAVQKTANDLRNHVKKAEGEKTELARMLQDAKQKISVLEEQKAGVVKEAADLRASLREVEKARLDARRELQELRRQVRRVGRKREEERRRITIGRKRWKRRQDICGMEGRVDWGKRSQGCDWEEIEKRLGLGRRN